MTERYFTPALFTFLNELEENNEKTWWVANKDRYASHVREPSLRFIGAFETHLKAISPHFVADSRATGGSLMRPYRDIRFSSDKTPYKTNVGIQFRHVSGKDIHAPGFYLHLEPRACFAGVGLWHPETAVTRRIRQSINDDPEGWKRAAKGRDFTDVWSTTPDDEDMLQRVPPDLDPDHPYPDDLRMKSFVAGMRLSQTTVTASGFDDRLAGWYEEAAGFAGFLCEAVGVEF